MYVIVVGGGTVGYYLSRDLLDRGHEVTLIEKDGRRADWLETQLGSIVMRGDGCEVKFLSQTGIERADAIVAVTADDEDNLIALQMAKRHFNVKKTIARVNNPSNVSASMTPYQRPRSFSAPWNPRSPPDETIEEEKDRRPRRSLTPRFSLDGRLADLVDLRAAERTCAHGCRLSVLHRDRLRVNQFDLLLVLKAVAFH